MSIHPIDDEGEDLAGQPDEVAPPQPAAQGFDEDREAREWLANVYQGDRVRQLSLRSIVTGMLIGGVMSISNLYVGLKTGWGLGVTITACIIAYAVFRALETVIPWFRNDPFTILENNTCRARPAPPVTWPRPVWSRPSLPCRSLRAVP
ncbi:MAG TPA: OPT/YSL family transporter [Pirellulales bacterium]|nr:OPT/YSL family transporter [Pirellulales bacterium]